MLSAEHAAVLERAALALGDMRVLMTRTQLKTNRKLATLNGKTFYLDCSRRWGKTRYAAIKSYEAANAGESRIGRYCAPTKNHGRQFVEPAFDWVASLLPEAKRARFDRQANTWRWPNGSVCHLGSAETMGDVEAQVGTECHFGIGDEVGKMRSDLFKHWHRSVMLPQFLTTNGFMLIATTPPMNMGHYCSELMRACKTRGSYARYTIEDCDHVSVDARRDVIREILAPDSIAWEPWMEDAAKAHPDIRREMYCEHISDPTRMIVPEWQQVAEECVAEIERPEFADHYCAADFGFEDLTVVVWGFYDFASARLVITHELAMHRASGLDVGFKAREVEQAIGAQRVFRCADAPVQMLADLMDKARGPGLVFAPALKDDAQAAINKLRMLIQQKRIVIHPRCKTLISHLHNGTWNAARTGFERVEGYGHWDAIDALKYMIRTINWGKNPFPAVHPSTNREDFVGSPKLFQPQGARRVLNRGRS
jgi:hypothetical protein